MEIMEAIREDTHHSFFIPLYTLHYLLAALVPEEHVATVTATNNVLTLKTKEVHTLH